MYKTCVLYVNVCFLFCPLASFNSSQVFYPPPLLLPILFLSIFFFFFFIPASLVSLSQMLQRSSRNSAVCHHILAVGIKPIHNYVMLQKPGWNKGAETQKHEEGECERRNMHQPHASSQTHHPAIPQQRGDHHSTQTHTDNLSKCTGRMPQNQANEWSTKGKTTAHEREKRVPCSAFRCARPWKEEANTEEKNRERRWKQRHTNTTVVLSFCMLCMMANHDDHSESKAFPRAFESFLLQETDNYRAATYANIKLFTLKQPLTTTKHPCLTY